MTQELADAKEGPAELEARAGAVTAPTPLFRAIDQLCSQRVALDGGVIVTTPQEIALLDVRRGVAMFDEVDAGTAIFKVTSTPPTQARYCCGSGLSSP